LTSYGPELVAKQLELLKEAVPWVKRVAALHNPNNPLTRWPMDVAQAGRTLAIQIVVLPITGPDDVAVAFRDDETAGRSASRRCRSGDEPTRRSDQHSR
jgi:hypothetical protein